MKNVKFINNIKDEIKHKIFSTKSFLELNDYCMYNILSFSFPYYDILVQTNKILKKKIHITLNNKFNETIRIFRNLYSEHLELQEYYFKPKYIKKHKNQCI